MTITISALTFDPLGSVTLQPLPSSDIDTLRRRVSRIETLDGGVALNDFGYTDGDRTLQIEFRPRDQAQEDQIKRLLRLHGRVRVSTRDGVYLAAPESYARSRGANASLKLLLLQKLTED